MTTETLKHAIVRYLANVTERQSKQQMQDIAAMLIEAEIGFTFHDRFGITFHEYCRHVQIRPTVNVEGE